MIPSFMGTWQHFRLDHERWGPPAEVIVGDVVFARDPGETVWRFDAELTAARRAS